MREPAKQCAYYIERRGKGLRYVYSRQQCKNRTKHPSGYCWWHRPPSWEETC